MGFHFWSEATSCRLRQVQQAGKRDFSPPCAVIIEQQPSRNTACSQRLQRKSEECHGAPMD